VKQASIGKPTPPAGALRTFSGTRPFVPTGLAASPALSPSAASIARQGHDFATVSVSVGAPVQRVSSKGQDQLRRWAKRGRLRKAKHRIAPGRYSTPTGNVTVTGLFGQRMTQARKDDYGGETLGSVPSYSDVRANLPDRALNALLGGKVAGKLTSRQRLAASLGTALTHVSEEDREPGSSKFVRALIRRRLAKPTAEHPFDEAVNPAVGFGGAAKMRDFLEGKRPLTEPQREAVDQYASDSSDDDDPYHALRKGIIKKELK